MVGSFLHAEMQSTVTRALQAMIYPPASRHLDISGHGLTGTSEDKRTKLGCPSSAGAGQSGRFMTWCGRSCVWGLKTSSPQISWYIMSLTWVIIVFPINSTLFRGINGYLRITCNLGKLWDICFPNSSIFQNTTSLLNGSFCRTWAQVITLAASTMLKPSSRKSSRCSVARSAAVSS